MAVSTITITSGASTLIPTVEPVVLTLGTVGPQGAAGVGVPAGGTAGQILQKDSATNYDTSWIDNFTTDVRQTIKNDSGSTLAKGTAVYVSGANGTNVLVKAALANADSTSATTLGLLYQQLANNGTGYVITEGLLTGIDTSAATAGDPVWLSGTVAGGLLFGWANEPKAPTHIVYLGTVARAHATLGEILVTIRNGWELDELHNVLITSPTNGQVLTYQSSTGLWINSSETGDISAVNVTAPITGGGTSGAVTIGIDQTAITIAESQVTNLVSDLAGKVPTSRTITAATGITGGGDLSANRTIGLDNTVVSYDAASSLRSLPLYNQKDAAERLLAQAVWWIDAAHSSASGQTITNLGWGGSALNATAGSTGSADSNDPKFLDWTGTNYVYLPGVTSNYLQIPDETALDITGDIDIRVYCALDDWTPAGTGMLASKADASNVDYSWALYTNATGVLNFAWTANGSTINAKASTVAPTVTDGSPLWVRVTLDVDNGASGNTVTFYTSSDGSSWSQLGSTVVTAGTTSVWASAQPVQIGAKAGGTTLSGNYYKAQILNGIGGTTVLNVDTSVITSGAATSFTALTGQTVTINRATSGRKTCVVTNPLWLFGTDDYIETADNDLLDFALTDSFSVVAIMRQWATQASRVIIGKGQALGTTAGYAIYSTSTNDNFMVADGTNQSFKGSAFTTGAVMAVGGIRDVTPDTVASWVNGTLTSGTDVTTATSSNASALRVGRDSGSVYADFEGMAFAVFRRALTTAEMTLIYNYYQTRIS